MHMSNPIQTLDLEKYLFLKGIIKYQKFFKNRFDCIQQKGVLETP